MRFAIAILFCASTAAAQEPEHFPPSLGLAPDTPQAGNLLLPTETPGAQLPASDWRLDFHGFLSAPMRVGLGSGNELQLDSAPLVPDANYVNWAYTSNLQGPWTQLNLTYGTSRVAATVIVAAYDLTDASWQNLTSQLGINQAYLTINLPDIAPRSRFQINVGAFSVGYGGSGRYDAGRYNTYLFGRTHVAGESAAAQFYLPSGWALHVEEGFGAKIDVQPFSSSPTPPGLPYPGPAPQGSTLLAHAHLGLSYKKTLEFGLHWMDAFTQDSRADMTKPDGSIRSAGADVRLIGGVYGDGYIGVSNVDASHALSVASAIEVLHSIGGWQLRDNYLGPNSDATGSITSVLFQYTYSIATLLRYPSPFWGQGPDVLLTVFGMLNFVSSQDPMYDGVTKLKWGADVTYIPLSWLAVSGRYDLVQPNLSDDRYSFSVVSPKLIFRTAFLTHEQVVLGYSHYFYGEKVTPTYPYMAMQPDGDVVQLAAVMWW